MRGNIPAEVGWDRGSMCLLIALPVQRTAYARAADLTCADAVRHMGNELRRAEE